MSDADAKIDRAFFVPLSTHWLSGAVDRWPGFWTRLGGLESWVLRDELRAVPIDRPVYVAGLARSGSTVLLEILASHPHAASHQYRDFPLVHIPHWWRKAQARSAPHAERAVERAHMDGIMVTTASPEAMEEMIWMAYFRDAHNPAVSQVLGRDLDRPDFETFYRDHIRKLILADGGRRYVAKGNYNFSRFGFLQKLFPDARFVVPVRAPLNHIASLIKQQRLFARGERRHRRALEHMRRVGHYEFGLDRRPINVGSGESAREVMELWRRGEEVRGWAKYLAYLYGWLADQLEGDAGLRGATLVVRYEDLCGDPRGMLDRLLGHCGLEAPELAAEHAGRIQSPTYYRPDFTETEEAIIREETSGTAERFGYSA